MFALVNRTVTNLAPNSHGASGRIFRWIPVTACSLAGAAIFTFIQITAYSAGLCNSRLGESRQSGLLGSQQHADAPILASSSERWTGDLDGMVKRRNIRALVVYSRSGFFFDQGRPEGIFYEALQELQRTVNRQFKTGNLPISISFVPVEYSELENSLLSGQADLIAVPIAITPERQQRVAFSTPLMTGVTQTVVTGPSTTPPASLADLSGKDVFVNPLTVYSESIQKVNDSLQSKGMKPIHVISADSNLGDEDLLEMVNAGLIPATVTINVRALFWSKVFHGLHICASCVLGNEEQLAWVMRKDSPKLKQLVDRFIETHREGTSFGNTLLRRYLQNTQWVKNSTSDEEMKKFYLYLDFFRKYSAQYDFDYLMLVALSYQESGLNQDRRNPTGALGIMQVIPKFAAAPPIDIPNVDTAEPNIHAGTKMLRVISDTYFNDTQVDRLNRTLFTFASYNAGPNRIAELRRQATRDGLDANVWFGNVELEVAKHVGQETVRYVSNIYKYYIAYKLILEQSKTREELQDRR